MKHIFQQNGTEVFFVSRFKLNLKPTVIVARWVDIDSILYLAVKRVACN